MTGRLVPRATPSASMTSARPGDRGGGASPGVGCCCSSHRSRSASSATSCGTSSRTRADGVSGWSPRSGNSGDRSSGTSGCSTPRAFWASRRSRCGSSCGCDGGRLRHPFPVACAGWLRWMWWLSLPVDLVVAWLVGLAMFGPLDARVHRRPSRLSRAAAGLCAVGPVHRRAGDRCSAVAITSARDERRPA